MGIGSLLFIPWLAVALPWSTYQVVPPPGAQVQESPGIVYTRKDGREPDPGLSLGFWLLNRSKKVWFRVEEVRSGTLMPHYVTFRGRPIDFRNDSTGRGPHSSPVDPRRPILWQERVESGWGRGPRQTNFYVSILTRWSLFHFAGAHPESFVLHYWAPAPPRPSHRGAAGSG